MIFVPKVLNLLHVSAGDTQHKGGMRTHWPVTTDCGRESYSVPARPLVLKGGSFARKKKKKHKIITIITNGNGWRGFFFFFHLHSTEKQWFTRRRRRLSECNWSLCKRRDGRTHIVQFICPAVYWRVECRGSCINIYRVCAQRSTARADGDDP